MGSIIKWTAVAIFFLSGLSRMLDPKVPRGAAAISAIFHASMATGIMVFWAE